MDVLIVARTKMTERVCVGGIDTRNGTSLRLMTDRGQNQPPNCSYQVGDIWRLEASVAPSTSTPHVEDRITTAAARTSRCDDLAGYLRRMYSRGLIPNWWTGPIARIFDGLTRSTQENFSRFISAGGRLPSSSVGFWEPHADLVLESHNDRVMYRFETPGELARLPYKGLTAPLSRIPRGTLLRVSLSRRWGPSPGREGYWVQMSGWYRNQTADRG